MRKTRLCWPVFPGEKKNAISGFTDPDEREPICLDNEDTALRRHIHLVPRCLIDTSEEVKQPLDTGREIH